jgi:hypothetical protein
MKLSCSIAVGLLAVVSVSAVTLAAIGSVPVIAGKEAELDACMTLGKVSGLDPHGDGFLAVRTGPGEVHQMVDTLAEGRHVYICDDRGTWLGIVYSNEPVDDGCGVTSPWPAPAPYAGPCRSGWVAARWIKDVAG